MVSQPLVDPAKVVWNLPITAGDYQRMLGGFSPRDMDDKWRIKADEPDMKGNTVLHMSRSWTGIEMFALTIAAAAGEGGGGIQYSVSEFAWLKISGNDYKWSEKEAKETAVTLCKNFLGCRLEAVIEDGE